MSDHTDDGFPRERYEGPMASVEAHVHDTAGYANGCAGCDDLVTRRKTDPRDATIMASAAKAETVMCGTCHGEPQPVECPDCSGTGFRTTGVLLGTLPSTLELIAERDATIAEQAAEIERLKAERDTHLCPLCHGTGMTGNVNDREACERCEGTGIDAYTEMIAELTTNRYAALEAERDALRRQIDGFESGRRWSDLTEERNEANVRAEKYLAVIRAKDAELVAVHRCWLAAIKSTEAMAEAGIVVKACVPSEQEEADHE